LITGEAGGVMLSFAHPSAVMAEYTVTKKYTVTPDVDSLTLYS